MSDRIAVRGIRAWGRHGVNPREQDIAQPFDVDVELDVDVERSAHTDEIKDALDYRKVHKLVVEVVTQTNFALLERLAQEIVRRLLQEERVHSASVTVAKPGILSGATPSVHLTRRR